MNVSQILGILSTIAASKSQRPPKEEKPKEEKPEVKIESKRSGGVVGSASKRADGIAQRGKTRGKMI